MPAKSKKYINLFINPYTLMKKQIGLTLLELMISLILGLVIFSFVLNGYLTASRHFEFQKSLNKLQENGRFVTKMLQAHLNLAGYIGCPRFTDDFPLKNASYYDFNPQVILTTYQHPNMKPGTQGISVRYASLEHDNLLETMSSDYQLILTPTKTFLKGDVLVISDCQSADIFKVQNIMKTQDANYITSETPLSKHYSKNAEVSELQIEHFFVGETTRQTQEGHPIYALYWIVMDQPKTELIEDVDDMQVDNADKKGVNIKLTLHANSLTQSWYVYAHK